MVQAPRAPLSVRCFAAADTAQVISLWQRCELTRPWNDPALDIQRKQAVGAELFLVGEANGRLIASVMGGYDGHRGWMNYLAVDPDMRQLGYGKDIVGVLEDRLRRAGCPKLNLQVRSENTAVVHFYQQLGYRQDDVLSFGKRLIED